MKKQTKHWLNAAKDDLMVIERILDAEELTNMVAFHAQQSIEKSIKAILEEKENRVPRIHDIITLKGRIEDYFELIIDQEIFDQLNELYTDARYPADLGLLPDGKPSRKIAKEFFSVATGIHNDIQHYLSNEN